MGLPSWASERLKDFIRREQQELDYWDKFEELSNPEELTTAKENLNALLTIINYPSGENIFNQLADCSNIDITPVKAMMLEEFPKESERVDSVLYGNGQIFAAIAISHSFMTEPLPTSKELKKWEHELEEALSTAMNLLRNAPEVKRHINGFSSHLAWPVIRAQKELMAEKIIKLIDVYEVDGKNKDELIDGIKNEGGRYTGDYMPGNYPSVIRLIRELLESGEISKGQGVLGKTKGKYAERAYFIRMLASSGSSMRPSNELIAEIASIIFEPIDAPGVSRILTKWK